jgi:hypothetical protein
VLRYGDGNARGIRALETAFTSPCRSVTIKIGVFGNIDGHAKIANRPKASIAIPAASGSAVDTIGVGWKRDGDTCSTKVLKTAITFPTIASVG